MQQNCENTRKNAKKKTQKCEKNCEYVKHGATNVKAGRIL